MTRAHEPPPPPAAAAAGLHTMHRSRTPLGLALVAVVVAGVVLAARFGGRPRPRFAPPAADVSLARDYVGHGRAMLEQGQLLDAEAAFRMAVDADPLLADAYRGLAAVAYDQGALKVAIANLTKVAELDPADGRPYRMMGTIHGDLDEREEAVAAYRAALERSLSPAARAEVREELAEQLLELGDAAAALEMLPPEATSAVAALIRAEATWSVDGADAALPLAVAAAAAHRDSARLAGLVGRLQVDRGAWPEAARELERATALDPADLEALFALATAYERQGRQADAEAVRTRRDAAQAKLEELTKLNRAANDRPWDAAVRLKLADVCESLGKHDLAEMWRRSAAACPPGR